MHAEAKEYPHPQGLRPGMRHEGQFKVGNEVRRLHPPRRLPDGTTLASYARKYSAEAVDFLASVMRGQVPDAKVSERLRATEMLLDRGFGKPTETVQIDLSTDAFTTMSDDQLRRIAAGALLPPIEGEAVEIGTADVTRSSDEDAT